MTIKQTNKPVAETSSDTKWLHINAQANGFINSAKWIRKVDNEKNVVDHLILKLALQQGKKVGNDYTQVKKWNFECYVNDESNTPSEQKLKDVLINHFFPEDEMPENAKGAKEFNVTNELTDRTITCAVTISDIKDIDFTRYDGKTFFLIKTNLISAGYVYENGEAVYTRPKQEEQPAEQQQAA